MKWNWNWKGASSCKLQIWCPSVHYNSRETIGFLCNFDFINQIRIIIDRHLNNSHLQHIAQITCFKTEPNRSSQNHVQKVIVE